MASNRASGIRGAIKSAQTDQADTDWIEKPLSSRELRESATTLQLNFWPLLQFAVRDFRLHGGRYKNAIASHHLPCRCAPSRQAKSYRRFKPEQVPELTKGLRRVVKHVTA